MRPAVVSVGAGQGQLPLIQKAHELGLAVVAVDRDDGAPGMRMAEERVVRNTHDPEAIHAELQALRPRFDLRGVVTKSSGPPVATTAELARRLGLPGLDPASARAAVTKPGMLELCGRAGVPSPANASCRSMAELESCRLPLPLVLKPSLTVVGKAGVSLVRERTELEARFEEARRASGDGLVEVEAFHEGADVVAVGLYERSRFRPLVLYDEDTRFDAQGRSRGHGFTLPSVVSGTARERELFALATRLGERLGLGTGIAFLTFRVPAEGTAVLIEVHFDLAGDFVSDRLFGAAGSIDLIAATLRLASGEPHGLDAVPRAPFRPTALRFLFAEDLGADGGETADRLRGLPGLLALELDPPPTGTQGGASRVGFALFSMQDPRGADEVSCLVDRTLGRGGTTDATARAGASAR